MPNTFSKVDWVVMETLRLYKNSLEVCSHFRTGYDEEFKKAFAVGDTVRVKLPWRPIVHDGFGYIEDNIERLETTVTVDQPITSGFAFDTIDKLLNMERGEERVRDEYLAPLAVYFAQEADKRAAKFAAQNTNNIVGVLQSDPTTLDATSAAARQRMVELACDRSGEKGMLVPPAVMRSIKGGTIGASNGVLSTAFNPVSEIEKLYKQGVVGYTDGFKWYESMSLHEHTAGTWAGVTNTLGAAIANGATSMTVTCTAGDTFNKGDVIGLGSVRFVNPITRAVTNRSTTATVVVQNDVTASSTSATVDFYPALYFSGNYQNIDSQPANGATLTLFPGTTSPNGKVGKQGLAIHKNAYAFVSLPLPMPTKEEVQTQKVDPDTGLSLAFIRSFDAVNRRWINRMDAMFGFGRLLPEAHAVRVLCA